MQQASTATVIIMLAIALLMIVSLWITVSKAGRPGVSQIIPIWNLIELVRISGKPLWWVILILLIPIVNLILMIMVYYGWISITTNYILSNTGFRESHLHRALIPLKGNSLISA